MSHLDLTPDDSVPTQLPSESMTAEATTPNQPANPQPVSQKPAQPTSQSVSQSTSQSSSQPTTHPTSQADSMVGLKIAVAQQHRRKGIATQLLSELKVFVSSAKVQITNVDEKAKNLQLFLQRQGLVNTITQIEMVKMIF